MVVAFEDSSLTLSLKYSQCVIFWLELHEFLTETIPSNEVIMVYDLYGTQKSLVCLH